VNVGEGLAPSLRRVGRAQQVIFTLGSSRRELREFERVADVRRLPTGRFGHFKV
jgi:hypothetical protein